jgi:hypothetical protein
MIFPVAPHVDAPLSEWNKWLHYLRNLPGWSASLERDVNYAMKLVRDKEEATLAPGRRHLTSTESGLDA